MLLNSKYELNLPDYRVKQWENPWEPERLDALRSRISDGTVVYDIGAETGDIPALMATWGAMVVCVEPSPYYWPMAKEVFKMNNVKPEYCYVGFASALTDETVSQEDPLSRDWPECTYGESREGFRHLSQESDVTPQVTIDELVKRTGLVPDILNIDVEGSCFEVLKGALKTLVEHSPEVFVSIHPEIMKEWYKTTPEDLFEYMEKLGYKKNLLEIAHEHHYYFFK